MEVVDGVDVYVVGVFVVDIVFGNDVSYFVWKLKLGICGVCDYGCLCVFMLVILYCNVLIVFDCCVIGVLLDSFCMCLCVGVRFDLFVIVYV